MVIFMLFSIIAVCLFATLIVVDIYLRFNTDEGIIEIKSIKKDRLKNLVFTEVTERFLLRDAHELNDEIFNKVRSAVNSAIELNHKTKDIRVQSVYSNYSFISKHVDDQAINKYIKHIVETPQVGFEKEFDIIESIVLMVEGNNLKYLQIFGERK